MNKAIPAFLITVCLIAVVTAAVFFTTGSYAVFFISTWTPAIAALIALLVIRQKAEIGVLLRSFRFDAGLLRAVPFLLFNAVLIAAALIIFVKEVGVKTPYTLKQSLINVPMLFFTGAIGEELGWRGVLLKQLLKKRNFIAASLITGSIWAVFHIPLWFAPELGYSGNPFPIFFISLIGSSFIYTLIYILSRGNLLSVVLLHFIQNYLLAFTINLDTEPVNFFVVYSIINLVLAVLIVVNWRKVEAVKLRNLKSDKNTLTNI